MRKILILLLSACMVTVIYSQEEAGGKDEIVLPQMSLEIEDIQNENITAEFPAEEPLENPVFEIDLPVLNELEDPDFDLDVSFSDENDEVYNSERSFFSEGIIGFGMQNHTLGEINLYTLGSDQDFNLKFAHENVDGYGFRDPGQGYFNTNTILDTAFKYNWEKHKIDLSLDYMQNEEGLQKQVADYQSYTLRFVSPAVSYVYSLNDNLSLNASLEYDDFRSILTGSDPLIRQEQRVNSEFAVLYLSDKIDFQLKNNFVADYAESSEDYDNRYNRSSAGIEYTSFANTRLGADISLDYDEDDFDVPFTLKIDSDVLYYLNVKLSGGYDVRYRNYYDLGREFYLVFQDQELVKEKLRFFEGSLSITYTESFLLNFNVRYEDAENMINFSESSDPVYGVFSVINEDAELLFADGSMSWAISPLFSLDLRHRAYLLDGYSIEPDHSFTVKADISNTKDSIGASVQSEFTTDEDIPVAGLSFFARVSSGLIFIIEANDILYPLLDDGRTIYGDFETKGFELMIKTQISF